MHLPMIFPIIFSEDDRSEIGYKSLISLVPVERIELPTFGLQNRYSAAGGIEATCALPFFGTRGHSAVCFMRPLL